MLRRCKQSELAAAFQIDFDANHDGMLDVPELQKGLVNLGIELSDGETTLLMSQVGVNESKKVSTRDFAKFVLVLRKMDLEAEVADAFRAIKRFAKVRSSTQALKELVWEFAIRMYDVVIKVI